MSELYFDPFIETLGRAALEEFQLHRFRMMLDKVLAGEAGVEAMQYAGGVVGWRSCYYHELLYDFERRWDEFVEAKHPWWKKSSGKPVPKSAVA